MKRVIMMLLVIILNPTIVAKANEEVLIEILSIEQHEQHVKLSIKVKHDVDLGALFVRFMVDQEIDIDAVQCMSRCISSFNHKSKTLVVYPDLNKVVLDREILLNIYLSNTNLNLNALILDFVDIQSSDAKGLQVTQHKSQSLLINLSDHQQDDDASLPPTQDRNKPMLILGLTLTGLFFVLYSDKYQAKNHIDNKQ